MDHQRIKYLQERALLCIDTHDMNNLKRVLEDLRFEFLKPIEVKLTSLHFEALAPDWLEYFEKELNIKLVEEDDETQG